MEKKLKVLVIGAGIAGPAAAILLKRKGHDVELIERAPEIKNIGFALTVWPNGHRILEEIGVDAAVRKSGYRAPWLEIADAAGHRLGGRLDFKRFDKYGAPLVIIERVVLHGLMTSKMEEEGIEPRLGVSVTNLIDDGELAHVEFSNGGSGAYDLVVAADGIRSEMRERLFGEHKSRFYGWSMRGFWTPPSTPIPRGTVMLSKEKRTLAIYPVKGKAFVAIYEHNPRRQEGADSAFSLEDFLPYLRKHGWSVEHVRGLEAEGLANHQFYDHLRHVLKGAWHKGRVVLIGDARHGLSPLIGMGANMALEDAWVLADEIGRSTTLPNALRRFSARRSPRVEKIRKISAFAERIYLFTSPATRFLRNALLRVWPKSFFGISIKAILSRQP